MIRSVLQPEFLQIIADAQRAFREGATRTVEVEGRAHTFPRSFPSPGDWRRNWIYFLMLDRFNNPDRPPAGPWNQRFNSRQGGTFNGVRARLGYLKELGAGAVWLSPVLKNSKPDWQYNYHGYGAQDFLNLDERFASDGTLATAEQEFAALVDEAHARGIRVILDIVLNHSSRVFDYLLGGSSVTQFKDAAVLDGPLGDEPPVRWLNGFGFPRDDWQDRLDPPERLHPDDAVWPSDLQNHLFFRRRGTKLSDHPDGYGFVRGDFEEMRQLVVEYDATGQEVREPYGVFPVLNILIQAHAYLIARYDIDGFRIDTVKYVCPRAIETFGNAMREFALTVGKENFFTFAEVYDDEETIAKFTGRNGQGEGFGVDAALDFPLFYKLPRVAKGMEDVASIRQVFEDRTKQEKELLSSHGEAGRFFVSFLDNHDQKERIQHPETPTGQVTLALALMFTLQGIPCVYYGTEQGLHGTVGPDGKPDLGSMESIREALWGKPGAFETTTPVFLEIQKLSQLRLNEPALSCGRLYFREVSGNGTDFGQSSGTGGVVAFSRVLFDREVLVVANTGGTPFTGLVVVDRDLNAGRGGGGRMRVVYSNVNDIGIESNVSSREATIHKADGVYFGPTTALQVSLAASEVKVLTPM